MEPVSFLGIIYAVLQAFIAIPKIGELAQKFAVWFGGMLSKHEKEQVRKKIEKAAITTRLAKTKEERLMASKRWHDAIKSIRR